MVAKTRESQASSNSAKSTNAGKYLTFLLGHESYGISVLKVREIIRLMDITSVPQMPPHVKGVINLRGKVVPIVDLRIKFALANGFANVVQIDSDGQHDPTDVPRMLEALDSADLVIGARFAGTGDYVVRGTLTMVEDGYRWAEHVERFPD